jgi:hypothetical protein
MRMRRLRFTVRGMMIAVAIVGLAVGCLAERRARFTRIYNRHSRYLLGKGSGWYTARSYRIIDWNVDMYEKYERAVRYPWLPVAPDPPEPE